MRPEVQLVTLTGRAGTGKTLLALAAALEQRRTYHQIFLARPVVPMGNRDIGYLPGDVKSKLDPYMQPLWDNISVIRHRLAPESRETKALAEMIEHEKINIAPLAYIRGRSLDHVFFIVDEAQNLTPARGEDDHHPRRRGLEGRVHGGHPADRHARTSTASRTGSRC